MTKSKDKKEKIESNGKNPDIDRLAISGLQYKLRFALQLFDIHLES